MSGQEGKPSPKVREAASEPPALFCDNDSLKRTETVENTGKILNYRTNISSERILRIILR